MDNTTQSHRMIERRANPHGVPACLGNDVAETLIDFAGLILLGAVMFAFGAGFAGFLQAVLP